MLSYAIQTALLFFTLLYSHDAFAECHLSISGLNMNHSIIVDADEVISNTLTKRINFNVTTSF